MVELIALRHLPTAWNRADLLQGRADTPIDPPSAGDETAIARNLSELATLAPFDSVYCSTLQRTRQTATLYGYPEAVADGLLDEFDFGRFEGRAREELLAEVGHQWLTEPQTLVLGESMSALEGRIRKFLAAQTGKARVLIFGHGCWLRALHSLERRGTLEDTNRITLEKHAIFRVKMMERGTDRGAD